MPRKAKKSTQTCSQRKVSQVMREFNRGQLKRPGGKVVKRKDVALAIAYSEARKKCGGNKK